MLKVYILKNKSDVYSAFSVYRFIYITVRYTHICASQVSIVVKNPPTNVRDARVTVLISGSGRSPGVGNGNSLQYSCLENSMERGAWQATAQGLTNSQTRLSN